MKKRNTTIDLIRLIASLMVICLHCNYGELQRNIVDVIKIGSRWAVPFFFMTTGFFLCKEDNELIKFPEKRIKNLISIHITSSIIFILIKLLNNESYKFGLVNILNGTYYHLWFIGSSILGLIAIWYIYKIGLNRRLQIITLAILIITLLTDGYDIIVQKNIDYMPFLLSIPFIIIGNFVSKKTIKINKLIVFFLLVASFTMQYFENHYLRILSDKHENYRLFIGTIFFTIILYILISKIEVKGKKTVFLALIGRKHSLFIYLYHPIFIILLPIIAEQNKYISKILNLGFQPLIIFTLTITFALCTEKYFPRFYGLLNGNIKFTDNS